MVDEKAKRVSALIGMLAVHPPLSAVAQQTLLRVCESGYVEEAAEALAHALLQDGIVSGKIPPNSGKKKKVQDIDVACVYVAKAYGDQGGVLYARGWVANWKLAALMLRQWNAGFSPEIPVSRRVVLGMPEQEVADRICIAILNCRAAFLERVQLQDGITPIVGPQGEEGYRIAKEDLETVLNVLVKAALEAFDDPNAVNHRLLHGPKA